MQGFSMFFKAKYPHFQGPITYMKYGVMTKTLTILILKLIVHMIFNFILPFEKFIFILNNNRNIFIINCIKTLIKWATIYFNNEQLRPKNVFSRLFKIFFKFKAFKGLKTIPLIQGYSRRVRTLNRFMVLLQHQANS